MNATHVLVALVLVVAAVAVGCSTVRRAAVEPDEQPAPEAPSDPEPSPSPEGVADDTPEAQRTSLLSDADLAAAASTVNAFGSTLFARVAAGTDGNVLVSPVSVSGALQMTLAGAAGDTRDEMAVMLGVGDDERAAHIAVGELQRVLGADGAATVEIANRVWLEGSWAPRLRQTFGELLNEAYDGSFDSVDFLHDHEAARRTINAWVGEQTRDKIPELIPMGAVDDMTRLVLTNAVYFDADWLDPFDADQTIDGPFHRPDGDVTAALMHRRDELRYAASDAWQAVALPYRERAWEMLVLLPSADGADAIAEDLGGALDAAAAGMHVAEVDLTMPKFRFRWNGSLAETLKAMGMEQAFDRRADFSRMADLEGTDGLFVSDVLHEAFVEVDEEGTEAAAATAVIVATRGAMVRPEVVQMRVDRPFFFALRHVDSGALLFMGRVEDPAVE